MIAFLQALTAIGIPALKIFLDLIPTLKKYKILRDEAYQKELERRVQEALKQTERSANEPSDASNQYKNAKTEVRNEYEKKFGGAVPPNSLTDKGE